VAEVRPQVERILSLDVDGSGFSGVGELDPVVGEIQRRYPGLRPVGFPSPQQLAKLDAFPGLAGRKPEWLRSLAQAALDGQLDTARLRALPVADALADLKKLPGIGDFSAGLILLRGASAPDAVPSAEPRLARAVALAYG